VVLIFNNANNWIKQILDIALKLELAVTNINKVITQILIRQLSSSLAFKVNHIHEALSVYNSCKLAIIKYSARHQVNYNDNPSS
jgi:hypothetical protein